MLRLSSEVREKGCPITVLIWDNHSVDARDDGLDLCDDCTIVTREKIRFLIHSTRIRQTFHRKVGCESSGPT